LARPAIAANDPVRVLAKQSPVALVGLAFIAGVAISLNRRH
jgi:hypothetical protein